MSNTVKIAIVICAFALIVGLGVTYVKTSGNKDVNNWLCGIQSEWGIPKSSHFHPSDFDGRAYTCK